MFLLDTCAVSEIMRKERDPGFQQWFSALAHDDLALPTIAVTELFYGIHRLPTGKRKAQLMRQMTGYVGSFQIFGFCLHASRHASEIMARLHGAGENVKFPDAAIAAIALHNDTTLVTRDADFSSIQRHEAFGGFKLINPWQDATP